MSFQAAPLRADQTTGVSGEFYGDAPKRVEPWILDSSGTPQIFGYAFHKLSDGVAEVGGGDTGVFLGILVKPKEHALVGTGASALTPVNFLADDVSGDLCKFGTLYVQLDGSGDAGTVGAVLHSTDATGAIGAGAAGAGETLIPNALVILQDVADDGLAIVELTN